MKRRGLRISSFFNPILKTTHPHWVLNRDEHLVNAILCYLSYNNMPTLFFRWASIIAHNTSRNIPNLPSVYRDYPPIHRLLLMGFFLFMQSLKCSALIWARQMPGLPAAVLVLHSHLQFPVADANHYYMHFILHHL